MIHTSGDGYSYLTEEDAEKIRRYDRIVEIINERDPYNGNRETCKLIRAIISGGEVATNG